MKILIVVNSLQQGGAERASVRLAESFLMDKHQVVLATWNSTRDFYSLDSSINRIDLGNFFNCSGFFATIPGRPFVRIAQFINLRKHRKEIKKIQPDAVICFEALIGSITAISLLGTKIPIVISERVNPNPAVYKPHQIAQTLRPFIYRRLATCSVQTQGFANWVQSNWKITAVVTPNHIPGDWMFRRVIKDTEATQIISIGRVEPQKGFDILLNAWSRLGDITSGKTLEIFGSQNNFEYLEFLMGKAPSNVHFHDAQEDIKAVLDESSVFVSSSRFEGFPNVVLEALARGVPTIASFSSDIINTLDNVNALLGYEPEDEDKLTAYLRRIIEDSSTRKQLSMAANEAISHYTWEEVGKNWYLAIEKAKEQKLKRIRWFKYGR
jgi:GalNAc-alpha-(1->4)-GalNAc-alpha-(1->3)-diNAcBac-PP-undecaprenol alpha-1,4-N-acetyl-D-galactosaminyltransferase